MNTTLIALVLIAALVGLVAVSLVPKRVNPETGTRPEPIESLNLLEPLPVWVDRAPNDTDPPTYDGVFWEVDPLGEYLYFLAGDYLRNETGLLRFPSATTSLRVEVSFETDVIATAQAALAQARNSAEVAGNRLEDLAEGTLGEVLAAHDPVLIDRASAPRANPVFNTFTLGAGYAQLLVVGANDRRPALRLVYHALRKPEGHERRRLVSVFAETADPDQPIGDLSDTFGQLIETYRSMPYAELTGALRI